MKKILVILLMCVVAISANAQKYFDKIAIKTSQDSINYALGVVLSKNFVEQMPDPIDANLVGKAFKDASSDNYKISPDDAIKLLQDYFAKVDAIKNEKALEESKQFLEANLKKDGVKQTQSGLQYKILNSGNDVRPTDSDTVYVHYEGSLIDGSVFDSSYDQEEPIDFLLGQVIPGFSEGISLIGEGGHVILYIPSQLGYGEMSPSPAIPANSILIFDVELIKVVKVEE